MRRGTLLCSLLVAGGAAAAVLAPSAAQDAPAAPREPTVLVRDISGAEHRLAAARLFAESIGLLSISLEPTDEFQLKVGAGIVKVPVRLIRSIEFGGGEKPGLWATVTVTDRQGNGVTGVPDKPEKAEIRGELTGARFAKMELPLNSVSRIVFEGPAPAQVCEKCKREAGHPDWKFCPHDGQRYPKEGSK